MPSTKPLPPSPPPSPRAISLDAAEAIFSTARARLCRTLASEGITNAAVLAVLAELPRHLFIPADRQAEAYRNAPVAIGEGQTISQPYIVALMTELAELKPTDRVLEIGTGSAYQTAVLARLAREVFTIEIIEPLAARAAAMLTSLDVRNVHTRLGDGHMGWPEAAPFDAIVVTAAPLWIPPALMEQLGPGGRLVVPVGDEAQELRVVRRLETGFVETKHSPVRFVPMTGRAQG